MTVKNWHNVIIRQQIRSWRAKTVMVYTVIVQQSQAFGAKQRFLCIDWSIDSVSKLLSCFTLSSYWLLGRTNENLTLLEDNHNYRLWTSLFKYRTTIMKPRPTQGVLEGKELNVVWFTQTVIYMETSLTHRVKSVFVGSIQSSLSYISFIGECWRHRKALQHPKVFKM